MGKKVKKPAASTMIEEAPHTSSIENQQQHDSKRHKMRSMAVLGEYMRYFGGVNGLYRNIVHMQAEVVSRHGRNGWRKLSPDDQDKAFDKHIVSKFVATESEGWTGWTNETLESEDSKGDKKASSSKEKPKSRRDSLHSITEYERSDGFSGPFMWKTQSLENLTFPPTPDVKEERKQIEEQTRDNDQESTNSERPGLSEAQESEDDVTMLISLDQLRKKLIRNYKEQQEARLKMREMEAEKNPGSPRKPERITKAAVKERLDSLNSPIVIGGKRADIGIPISPADLKPVIALKPVNRDRLRANAPPMPLENRSSQILDENRMFQLRSPTNPSTRPKSNLRSEPINLQTALRKSQDFDEILLAAEESHRKRTMSSGSRAGISPTRRDSTESGLSSRNGSVSIKGDSPDKKLTVKEISQDWNQYFSKQSSQSPPANGNSNLMDLFKNW